MDRDSFHEFGSSIRSLCGDLSIGEISCGGAVSGREELPRVLPGRLDAIYEQQILFFSFVVCIRSYAHDADSIL